MSSSSDDRNTGGLSFLDETQGLRVEEVLPPIDFDPKAKKSADDFMSQLDRMVKDAKERQQQREADIKVREIDAEELDTGLIAEALVGEETSLEQWLREARRLINEGQFGEALALLGRALEEVPHHPEALYLTAYCYHHLGQNREALRNLLPLRKILDPQFQARIMALKEDIREHIRAELLLETLVNMLQEVSDQSIASLRELVTLDPDFFLYHYLLTGILITADRFSEALEAVNHGLHVCHPQESQDLENLKNKILEHFCAEQMKQARDLFKHREFARARAVLRQLDKQFQSLPLYCTFDGYLSRLAGDGFLGFLRRKSPAQAQPPGPPQDAEALYFFLVGEEVNQGGQFIEQGDFRQAKNSLQNAIQHCPLFPFANFLYSNCLYRWMGDRLSSGDRPELQEVIDTLEEVRLCAQIAATDRDLMERSGHQPSHLLNEVAEILTRLRQVQVENARGAQEDKIVNPVIHEFQSIMERVGDGIKSPQHFQEIFSRMSALQKKLRGVQRRVQSEQGRQVLNTLAEAVQNHIQQLKSIKVDVEEDALVNQFIGNFNNRMESLQYARITSRSQLNQLRQFFLNLRQEVQAARNRVTKQAAKNALDQLLDAIGNVLNQLPY